MITEREQKYVDAGIAVQTAGGVKIDGKVRAEIISGVQILLPIWDEFMPLLVSDIVKAVKKELQNG